MEETSFFDGSRLQPHTSSPSVPSGKSRKRFYILIAIILLGLGIFFGRSFLSGESDNKTVLPSPTPTESVFPTDTPIPTPENSPTPGPTDTPTPKPTTSPIDKATGLDRSDLSVEVQNGSGVVGVASKASDVLKSYGYHVVSVGNASNYDYTDTVIMVKPENSKYLPLLKKDLSTNYTIGQTSETLSASSSAGALVIVGRE